jgi:hypothetical protein
MLVRMTGLAVAACAAIGFGCANRAQAAEFAPMATPTGAPIVLAADGCGAGWYRGPGGACHRFGWGPYPYGYYRPAPVYVAPPVVYAPPPVVYVQPNGCPMGYWRGPWGHCRDTPYHGRLPDGGWK